MRRSKNDVQRVRRKAPSTPPGIAREDRDLLQSLSKSIWQERHSRNFRFFCPFCANPRRLGLHPRLGQPLHFIQVGLCSAIFTILMWPLFGWKGMVSFVPLWTVFEVLYRWKVRASVACPSCGFDPVLCLADPEKAKQLVREHFEKKRAARSASEVSPEESEAPETMEETPAPEAFSEERELTQPV